VFSPGADLGSSFEIVEMFPTMSYQCSVGFVRGQQTLQNKQYLVWLSGWCVGGRRRRPNYLKSKESNKTNQNKSSKPSLLDMDYINTLGAVSALLIIMDFQQNPIPLIYF